MRDQIELNKVFEADPKARAEFDTVCDQWQNEAILVQDKANDCECDICAEEVRPPGGCPCWRQTCAYDSDECMFECEF